MTESIDSGLAHLFKADELMALHATVVEVGFGRQIDAPSTLEAWRRHVEKMERDLSLPDSDRTVWGAHDLLAALTIRNFVRHALDSLNDDLATRLDPLLLAIDEKFISFTEDDTRAVIGMVDEIPHDSSHWWWRRIPTRGPIRRELDRIAQAIS